MPTAKRKPVSLAVRRLCFRFRYGSRSPFPALTRRWMERFYQSHPAFVVDGVCVRDDTIGTSPAARERFLAYVRDALFLIQFHDPFRYRRIVRHFRFIANALCPNITHYHYVNNFFMIDFEQLTFEDNGTIHPWYVAYVAVLLVNGSTYAYLMDHDVVMTPDNWERITRICDREQAAFLAKLPRDTYDFVAAYGGARSDTADRNPFTNSARKRWEAARRSWQSAYRKKT